MRDRVGSANRANARVDPVIAIDESLCIATNLHPALCHPSRGENRDNSQEDHRGTPEKSRYRALIARVAHPGTCDNENDSRHNRETGHNQPESKWSVGIALESAGRSIGGFHQASVLYIKHSSKSLDYSTRIRLSPRQRNKKTPGSQ